MDKVFSRLSINTKLLLFYGKIQAMHLRIPLGIIAFSLTLSAMATSFNYAKQWERIAVYKSKRLPQSGLQSVDSLMSAASKEKNSAQFLKGWIYRFRFLMEKDQDNFFAELKSMEQYTATDNNTTEKAVLHSLLAKLYTQYFQQYQYTINQRPFLTGEKPQDIKEWSTNIFASTVASHVKASLENASQLQAIPATAYQPIMETGKDSRTLEPTLYDFLCARGIETLTIFAGNERTDNNQFSNPSFFEKASLFIAQNDTSSGIKAKIAELYRQWLAFRMKAGNKAALLHTDLQRLEYVYNNMQGTGQEENYLTALNQLKQAESSDENVVEVIARLAQYYLQHDQYIPTGNEENSRFLDYKKRAYDLCEEGILQFPHYKRIELLKSIQRQITSRLVHVSNKEILASTTPFSIDISATNIPQLEVRIYSIPSSATDYYKSRQTSVRNTISKGAKLVRTQKVELKTSPYFRPLDTTVVFSPLPYGIYEYTVAEPEASGSDKQACGQFAVSDLVFFSRTKGEKRQELYVVDRVTGHPQKNIIVNIYTQTGYGNNLILTLAGNYTTDNNGHVAISVADDRYPVVHLSQGKDIAFPCNGISSHFWDGNRLENNVPRLNLFTDRAVYRPGQTVYFKGIAWLATKDTAHVLSSREYTITLYDANYQEVGKQSLKTNDFGSFSGSFTLPKGRLNGNFTIQSDNNGSASFLVEEYKRSSFEITFDTIKGTPAFGDKVKLSGQIRSYADFPIENAMVKYRIVRRPHWLMRWLGGQETEIQNGQIKSDEKGNFEVSFVPHKQDGAPVDYQQFYTYSLAAEATDANGETQQNETSFAIGDRSMYLTADVKEYVDKKKPFEIQTAASNLNNVPVKTIIFYTISRLKSEKEFAEKVRKENLSGIDKQLLSSTVDTGKENKLSVNASKWESGKYLIRLTAKDEQGREVELVKTFALYSSEDKQLPVKQYCWLQELKTNCKPGESADILFGTSARDVKVLYELLDGNKILESKWMDFSDEIRHLQIPYDKEWDRGVTLQLTFIKDEQVFSKIIGISKSVEEKKLQPVFSVFRDKLLPGQKEEWLVAIPELQKGNKQAESMITMFDASLDIFKKHTWVFSPGYRIYLRQAPSWYILMGHSINNYYIENKNIQFSDIQLDDFSNILSQLFSSPNIMVRGLVTQVTKNTTIETVGAILNTPPASESPTALNEVTLNYTDRKKEVTGSAIPAADSNQARLRKNFTETAFFYPQLRTNEKGEVAFSFTAPESLTRWHVIGLAHTKDLYFGQWSAQTVTQKPFMVQPNLPRFVRESDRLVISGKLVNLSERQQAGTARLELIDPETGKPLAVADANRPFTVGKDGAETVSWSLAGFSGRQMLICKITASTEEFSDGEQRYLPVLPDKIRVTETLPLRIQGNQTKEYSFDRLLTESSKVNNKSLTAELTANPAWYAIQALPVLAMPDQDCSISWFTTYYANTLAKAIVGSNPKIVDTYKQWQESGDALQSNLEKNEELKNLLLTETPWVLEAKNESQQKHRIAELFDINRQEDNRRQALDKLASLQLGNGAFTWFKGMREDRFLTQYILEGMARLQQTGSEKFGENEKEMIQKAVAYADERMAHDFTDLKRYDKEWQKLKSLSADQIYYFYMRSSYKDIPVTENAVEAVGFYQKRLNSSWTEYTLLGKALIALTVQRNGDKKLAAEIAKSLIENATISDEKGMYWVNNRGGRWWHESNIATQTAILEALTAIHATPEQTDDMKLWLLSQKQTERWNSPIATADAVYALLMNGTDWLSGSNDVTLKLGNIAVQSDKKEAATGYFKTTYEKSDIRPEMGKISLENRESHPAWGAVYWQYETILDNVSARKGVQLNVDKKLYIERASPAGPVLEPVSAATPLKAGDKVTVRLIVTTDRDMEYVALTDQRAACLEPTEQLSGCRWKERVCYYQSTKDASTQFFFSFLPKGTYVFEYSTWITRSGTYSNGIATVQCQYAPEFSAHSAGEKIVIQ